MYFPLLNVQRSRINLYLGHDNPMYQWLGLEGEKTVRIHQMWDGDATAEPVADQWHLSLLYFALPFIVSFTLLRLAASNPSGYPPLIRSLILFLKPYTLYLALLFGAVILFLIVYSILTKLEELSRRFRPSTPPPPQTEYTVTLLMSLDRIDRSLPTHELHRTRHDAPLDTSTLPSQTRILLTLDQLTHEEYDELTDWYLEAIN